MEKAGSYAKHFAKIKITLTLFLSLSLVVFSKFISEVYYQKPIHLALLAGGIYLLFAGIIDLMQSLFRSYNFFKPIFIRETFFQGIRIIAIPLIALYLVRLSLGGEKILFWIIGILAFTYFASAVSFLFYKKINVLSLLKSKSALDSPEKKEVNRFLFLISATALSGVFFGYIDTIMLGRFVSAEYIGFYNIAFSFIGALTPLVTFSSTALLPALSKMEKGKREVLFNKSRRITFLLSIAISALVFIFSPIIIGVIFGNSYLASANILRIFSVLYLVMPLISIYSSYFTAIGRPGRVTRSLIISTVMNIVLNILFILYLIRFGEIYAVYGAAVATIISRLYYMFALITSKKKMNKKI